MPVSKSRTSQQENRTAAKSNMPRENRRTTENDEEPELTERDSEALGVTVKDLRIPDATVFKLMKEALPKNAVIAHDVKEIMRRLPTIFALFLTDHALQQTHGAKRRTLLPEDVVAALQDNGFSSYCQKVMPVVEQRRANFRSRKPKLELQETVGEEPDSREATKTKSQQVAPPASDTDQLGEGQSDCCISGVSVRDSEMDVESGGQSSDGEDSQSGSSMADSSSADRTEGNLESSIDN